MTRKTLKFTAEHAAHALHILIADGKLAAKDVANALKRREAGATPADYLFGPGIDEPLAMSRGGSIYYHLVDGLGSVSLVTNATGTVQDKYLYDAWGTTRSSTTPVANPFGYTAREFGEAGTLFYRARYYQPGIGRFLQEDPLGYAVGINLYAYGYSDPIGSTDPLGLYICGSGWRKWVIPDAIWGSFDFTEACQRHDTCYGTCGSAKSACDVELYRNALAHCATRAGGHERGRCRFAALAYYEAVKRRGQPYYDSAQAESGCTAPWSTAPPGGPFTSPPSLVPPRYSIQ